MKKPAVEARRQRASELVYEDEAFVGALRERGLSEKSAAKIVKAVEGEAMAAAEKTEDYDLLAAEVRKLKKKALDAARVERKPKS